MRNPGRTRRTPGRGSALLEAMIALSVLLIGLVGMARLQIYGMGATQGARAFTTASQLAAELAAALERLPAGDPRLSGAPGPTPTTPPTPFGSLRWGGVTSPSVHLWSDAAPVPGARLDGTLERDPGDWTQPIYVRRWTVWDVGVAANGTAAKVIAVSVIYRERAIGIPREVVRYVHSEVRGNFMANITAFN